MPNFQASAAPFSRRGYAQRMRRGTKVLLMAVLAVLIAVNVVLLFLLFRPDRALTAQPADQDPGMVVCLRRHQLLPVPAPRQIRRPRPDQSSRLLSNGCSSPRLPRRLGGRLLATATPPARLSGRLTAALAGNESYEPVRHRSCSSAPSQAAMCSPLAVRVRAARYRYVAYANDGTVTASANSPVDVWFPTPSDRDEINGPGETKATPCEGHVVGLAPLDLSRALVVCDNGAAMSTRNSGRDMAAGGTDPQHTRHRRWERSVLGRRSPRGLRRRDGAITDRKKRQPDARRNPLCCWPRSRRRSSGLRCHRRRHNLAVEWQQSRHLKGRWPDMEMTAVVVG